MPVCCWPFKKANENINLSTQNGNYKSTKPPTAFVNHDGTVAQKEEIIEDLRTKVERWQRIANEATNSLKVRTSKCKALEYRS